MGGRSDGSNCRLGITRQIIFGIAPKDGAAFTLSYGDVADGNSGAKAFTCALAPSSRGAGVSLSQTTIFLGTTGAALTFQTMRNDKGLDGATAVTYDFITNRIDPDSRPDSQKGRARTTKRFKKLGFSGFEPAVAGTTITILRDLDPIIDASIATYEAIHQGSDTTELYFNNGLCEWFHLRGSGSGNIAGQIILSNFDTEFYTVGRRPGGDS